MIQCDMQRCFSSCCYILKHGRVREKNYCACWFHVGCGGNGGEGEEGERQIERDAICNFGGFGESEISEWWGETDNGGHGQFQIERVGGK